MLGFHDVAVRRDGRTILVVGRLEIGPGERWAVLGANGAGKSTLLRVAAGLRPTDAGTVDLLGRPAGAAQLRGIATAVLQRPLLRRGTVRANVETGVRFHGVGRSVARERGERWMGRLGLTALADRRVGTLSGGEAQRVSLARAFAVEPRLLVLDEPFSALDAATRGELLADLRDILDDTGTAALLATHDRHEAAALTDHTAVLHAGQLRQTGGTLEVLDGPADVDCARTLGFENLIPADLAGRLLGPGAGARALRSEDCRVAQPGDRSFGPEVSVPVRVGRLVPLGPLTRVEVAAGDVSLRAITSAPPPPWLADAAAAGASITLRFAPARARRLAPLPYAQPVATLRARQTPAIR